MSKIRWNDVWLGLPAFLLIYMTHFWFSWSSVAMMAGGAFSAGFGISRKQTTYGFPLVLSASLAMAISMAMGMYLANGHPISLLFVFIVISATCSYLATSASDMWWLFLQVVISFLIGSYHPGDISHPLTSAGFLLLGGFIQYLTSWWMATVFRYHLNPSSSSSALSFSSISFTSLATVGIVSACWLAHHFHLQNGYWAPMATLLVFRSSNQLSIHRAGERLLGTCFGCLLATISVAFVQGNESLVFLLLLLSSGLAYAFQGESYSIFSSCVSATVVFLLALVHDNPLEVSVHRLLATGLGGVISLVLTFLLHQPWFEKKFSKG